MRKDKLVNIGIIGMGKMGLLHASILNAMPSARVTAIYDKNPIMKIVGAKALNNIRITDEFKEFTSHKYDAVFITTPIPTHFLIASELYSKGITGNIFIEKTMTSSYEQSTELCRGSTALPGIVMVGYMCRFAVTYRKAKALLQEQAIGKPISFSAYAYSSDFASVKGKSVPVRGGVTRDLGSHVIDLGLWYFGDLEVDPAEHGNSPVISACGSSRFKVHNHNGLTGDFDFSWCKEGYRLPEFRLTIKGDKGTIMVNADLVKKAIYGGEIATWYRHDLDDNVSFLLGAPEYYREDEHFINAVLADGSADPDFNTAAKVDRLIQQVEQVHDANG